MNWRLAYSLNQLRTQINRAYPNRNKASDGTIGDTAHQAEPSDHDPNYAGVVCALDITHDPDNGCDTFEIAEAIRQNPHPDLKYIISNQRITGAWNNWQWDEYDGTDPHTNHMHISVGVGNDGESLPPYDDTDKWTINMEEDMTFNIPDEDGYYARFAKYFAEMKSLQQPDGSWTGLSRSDFSKYYAGKDYIKTVEAMSDSPEATQRANDMQGAFKNLDKLQSQLSAKVSNTAQKKLDQIKQIVG